MMDNLDTRRLKCLGSNRTLPFQWKERRESSVFRDCLFFFFNFLFNLVNY